MKKLAKSRGKTAKKDRHTGAVLVEAMQEARRLRLKLKPMRYYPAMRPPVSFSDEER